MNVTFYNTGDAFCILVNGLTVEAKISLEDVCIHIQWMYEMSSQDFTVGKKRIPVEQWLEAMAKAGFID